MKGSQKQDWSFALLPTTASTPPKEQPFSRSGARHQIFCSFYQISLLVTIISYYKNNASAVSFIPQLCERCVVKVAALWISGSVENGFGAPKGYDGDTPVLKWLLSVQDSSGQECCGFFFSPVFLLLHVACYSIRCPEEKQSWQKNM